MKLFTSDRFKSIDLVYPQASTLVDLLLAEVRREPDRIALVEDGSTVSSAALLNRANAVATHLQQQAIQPDECVALLADSSLAQHAGLWGILLAGGAYMPLAPEYPAERLRYMIEDAGVSTILCQHRYREQAEALTSNARIIEIEDLGESPAPERLVLENLKPLQPRNLAYVIYTSGSTGRPKGVMIEHRSIMNQMEWLKNEHGIGPGARILQKTPASFDAAQWELLALATGATIILATPGLYRDPEGIIDTVVRHDATVLQCVPTLLKALVETGRAGECRSLRRLFSGGEALSGELVGAWRAILPRCALTNLYGPTECTINSSAFPVEQEIGHGIVSIGRPANGTRYYIVNPDFSPVADGEVGELLVSGLQVARGYLGRPELTAERFLANPFDRHWPYDRVYRTGDLARWQADGTVHYVGRADNQLKLRGYRVELDEIDRAIEAHTWVKAAASVVTVDDVTGDQNLVAYVELSPRQAALMDQGNHGAHHQSKASRLQVKAQLASAGARSDTSLDGAISIDLPGARETASQRALAFARKTYRFFDGAPIDRSRVERLLASWASTNGAQTSGGVLRLADIGSILRNFGPFRSEERLLPKYAYASPGALYATQLYLEVGEPIRDLVPGLYYFHPERHQLTRLGDAETTAPGLTFHFAGKRSAIEPVYRNNIREVLEMEAGHMIGLFDVVLAPYGLAVGNPQRHQALLVRLGLPDDDFNIASYPVEPIGDQRPDKHLELYLQPVATGLHDLASGQHRWTGTSTQKVADGQIERRHVIAINQQVYDRASFGISIVSDHPQRWRRYLELGRCLQRLQMNDFGIGFMSSGYSSESGAPLPSDRQLKALLASLITPDSATYFCIGGAISSEQRQSEGMREDIVHMQGPAELIKEDLRALLPDYMIPGRVVILDRLPHTANGKVDRKALETRSARDGLDPSRERIGPRTESERRISEIWASVLRQPLVSIHDDFFELGGNSLGAVALIQRINRAFRLALPLQTLFDAPNVAALTVRVEQGAGTKSSRAIRLSGPAAGQPVFCWPGLGGYAMNLRGLAQSGASDGRPFFGIQAHGLNALETPDAGIETIAARDVTLLREIQPDGPYSLWGYSFGARVAFETAYQLEQAGQKVDHLALIAPGSPRLELDVAQDQEGGFGDAVFLTILFSVFAGSIRDPQLPALLREIGCEADFVARVARIYPDLDHALIERITRIVKLTYSFRYSFVELERRRISAPITIFRATGDDYSFIDGSSGFSAQNPISVQLAADHYALLKDKGVEELALALRTKSYAPDLALAS